MNFKITKKTIYQGLAIISILGFLLGIYILYTSIDYKRNTIATTGKILEIEPVKENVNNIYVKYKAAGISHVVEIKNISKKVKVNDNYTIYYKVDNSAIITNNLNYFKIILSLTIISIGIIFTIYFYKKIKKVNTVI